MVLVESAPNEVRISVRSRPGLDIGRVMGYLGGGGHAQAAGAHWRGPLHEAKNHVVELIAHELRHQHGFERPLW